jgi:hypothetical protein
MVYEYPARWDGEESEVGALKNSLRVTEPLNLLPIPADERLPGTAARNLVGPAVLAAGPVFPC